MGCCVVRAPVVPDSTVPTPRSNERPPIYSVPVSQTGLWSSQPKAISGAPHSARAADLLLETSLQSLQIRLDL